MRLLDLDAVRAERVGREHGVGKAAARAIDDRTAFAGALEPPLPAPFPFEGLPPRPRRRSFGCCCCCG